MRPSYFDPVAQPDTETQYRQGGKVNKMQKLSVAKKMPRKFQAGGTTTAPAVKPAKQPSDPKLVEAAKQLEQEKRDAATQKKGAEKPVLGNYKMAKGGFVKKVRKFADGGETTAEDKDVSYDMPSEPKISGSRFGADTYERATRQLSGADKKASASTYKPSPKNVSTVKAGAKPSLAKPTPAKSSDYGNKSRRMTDNKAAPKEAPRFTAEGEMNSNIRQEAPPKKAPPKVEPKQESSGTEPKKSYGERDDMARSMDTPSAPDVNQQIKNNLAKARSGSGDTDNRPVNERTRGLFGGRSGATGDFSPSGASGVYKKGGTVKESKAMAGKEFSFMKKKGAPKSMVKHEMMEAGMKKGGKVAKYAKGGGIESKGKTRGKMC